MKKYYLAYGSNLNVQQMRFRCPDARVVGTAEILDYQLLFKGSKTGAYLTIEKRAGAVVPVGVWEVSKADELELDRYEGCLTFYYKTEMEIAVKSWKNGKIKTVKAFVYIMHEDRKLGVPRSQYVRTCVAGCRNFGFDLKHLRLALDLSERSEF